jgi:hypothetical protein
MQKRSIGIHGESRIDVLPLSSRKIATKLHVHESHVARAGVGERTIWADQFNKRISLDAVIEAVPRSREVERTRKFLS